MSDLERKLLAKLTDDPHAISEAWDMGIRADHFEQPLYQAVWNTTVSYWQKASMQAAPTAWVLQQEFAGYNPEVHVPEEIEYLCDLMLRRYAANQIQELLIRAAGTSATDPVGTLKQLQSSVLLATEAVSNRITRINMADTAAQRKEYYATSPEQAMGGATYGIDQLDDLTGGILGGEIAVIGAYAKTGKTMFLLNAAAAAIRKGLKPIVFTLELTLADTEKRLDAMWSGVGYNKIHRRTFGHGEREFLEQKIDELTELGGIPVERPEEGDRTAGALCARARQLGCNYIIIDQLSKMDAGVKTSSLKEKYGEILRQLSNDVKRPGQELSCLLAVQTRREDGEPTIQSFADAAEVERDCDIAITLWRNRSLRDNHLMKLEIQASRRTDITAFLLEWQLTNQTRIRVVEEVR